MKIDRFPFIAQRLFNVPLAVMPGKAEAAMLGLADRLGIVGLFRGGQDVAAFAGQVPDVQASYLEARVSPEVGYDVVQGVACVEISGTLVQERGTLRPYSGMTGYDGIRHNILAAIDDPAVRAVALKVNSYGGEVSGLFDLCDLIAEAAARKPVWGILAEDACSAAYAIVSACSRVTIPRTGITGSVGIIALVTDLSAALDKDGIKVHIIQRGDRKSDGQPFVPLSDAARAAFQAKIDAIGEIFEGTVSRNRGIPAETVRGWQAGIFMGADAVAAGLADAVMAPDAAFRSLVATL